MRAQRPFDWPAIAVLLLAALPACWAAEEPQVPKPVAAEEKDARQPLPSPAALAEAEKKIKDVYREEYQKRAAADRIELARKLMKVAQETKNEPLTFYVAMRDARDLAAAAGDIETALTAVDVLAWTFAVDAVELKTAAVLAAARNVATPDAAENAFSAALNLLDRLAADAQYEQAVKLLAPLDDLARRANNAEAAKTAQARAKAIRAEQAEWAKAKPHFDKLKATPDDADAALAAAKYLVNAKSDWERALPLLAKCPQTALKAAAAKELAQPDDAAGRADLGDAWWALSEKESGPFKNALQKHAADWYGQAVGELSGLRKLQTEKRIQSALTAAGSGTDWLRAAGLVFWVNPNLDASGRPRDLISNAQPTNTHQAVTAVDAGTKVLKFAGHEDLVYPATEAVRAIKSAGAAFVWVKVEPGGERYPNVLFRGCAPGPGVGRGYADLSLFVHTNRLLTVFNWPECGDPPWAAGMEGKSAFYSKGTLPYGKWGMLGCTWDGTTVSIYVNGERDNTYKFAASLLKRATPPSIILGNDPAGLPEYFIGMMHSAMIFNRALTEAEVKQLYVMSGMRGK
jgi:hypothetical protein